MDIEEQEYTLKDKDIDKIPDIRVRKSLYLTKKFLEDLIKLFAGHDIIFDYVDGKVAHQIQDSAEKILERGTRLEPAYGSIMTVKFLTDISNLETPVIVEAKLYDMSSYVLEFGLHEKNPYHYMFLRAMFDPNIETILNYKIFQQEVDREYPTEEDE